MRCLFVLPLFVLLFAAAANAATALNKVVAVVDNAAISEVEIQKESERLSAGGGGLSGLALRREALKNLIDRRLILRRAGQINVHIPDSLLQARLDEIRGELNLPDEEALRRHIEDGENLPYETFLNTMRENMLIQAVFYREVYLRTRVYEEEVRQFLANETDVGQKREYRLGHILIGADAGGREARLARAQTVLARARAGDDFAALARRYSGDAAAADGDLGFKTSGELPAVFVAAAQNLQTGETADIIETSRGFHILKLLDERGGGLRDRVRSVRLAHVFLPADEPEQAREVYDEMRNGGLTFAGAVKRHSIDPVSIDNGGDLGWFPEDAVPDYFAPALATLRAGEYGAPVESPYGWHIVLLSEEKTDAVNMEAMRDRAERVLRGRRADTRRAFWLQRLRGAASIRIFDPALADVLP